MAENSHIEWTKHTWNPWTGCTKVSAGCKFCYMYREKERYRPEGEKFDALTDHQKAYYDPKIVLRSEGNFRKPLNWHRSLTGQEPVTDRLVFTCSYSDFFHEDADAWRWEAWKIIEQTPHLTYQVLTKRPERIREHLPPFWFHAVADDVHNRERYRNVWLGTTVEEADRLDERFFRLIEADAEVSFLSMEPLLGPVHEALAELFEYPGYRIKNILHWVIVGGESGNEIGKYRYRPCEREWIQGVVDVCQAYGIPVFVKQLGTYLHHKLKLNDRHGRDWSEWPEALRVRQFPGGLTIPPPTGNMPVQTSLFQ